MDAVVTALYSRTMHLEVDNFMEIMGVADYLQVISAISLDGNSSAPTKPLVLLPILLHEKTFTPCC